MPITRLYILTLLWPLTVLTLSGQQLARRVSLQADGQPIGQVLQELERRYQLSFVYSSYHLPVDREVSLNIRQAPLEAVLKELLRGIRLEAEEHAGYIVLKPVQEKELGLSRLAPAPPVMEKVVSVTAPPPVEKQLAIRSDRNLLAPVASIESAELGQLPGGERMLDADLERYKYEWQAAGWSDAEENLRIAQVSLLPLVGTNLGKSDQLTNKVSVNVLWGINGGVDGVEVGGLGNTIYEDVTGAQVAGLGNIVRGRVTGTQVAGLFNLNGDAVQGVQVAGLFNRGEASNSGVQVAGLFNRTGGGAGVQVAGLFNRSRGASRSQAALLFNRSEAVRSGQFSLFFNQATEVRGVQFGLINVADTVSGVPIGLFNIIRKGYNRIEVGANDAFFVNTSYKFGARSFYNIALLGLRWDDREPGRAGAVSWSLGYGIGTALRIAQWWTLNLEGTVQQVNEQEAWTRQLNLLSRFQVTVDRQISKRLSFFLGPNLSVLTSRRMDAESGVYHSLIVPYTLHQRTQNGLTTSVWIGFGGGLRF